VRRVLILDHPQFTSATYYLWHGLKELEELFPNELEVEVYPYTPAHYHQTYYDLRDLAWYRNMSEAVVHWKGSPQDLPYGIPPFQTDEQLTAGGVTAIERGIKHRNFGARKVMMTEDEVVQLLNAGYYNLIVLGNSHRVPTIALSLLKRRVSNLPPIIYLDAGERDELNEHWVHVFRPEIVFKQILTPEVKAKGMTTKISGYNFKLYPLPLSSPVVDHPGEVNNVPIQWLRKFSALENSKTLDAFYALGNTWPERQKIVDRMDQWVKAGGRRSVIYGAPGGVWWLALAISRMGVSMRGSGRDTNRYWDIPTFATALVCDGTMGCIHPYPFENNKTALFYDSVDHLVNIVDYQLRNQEETRQIAMNGQDHLARYHSTAARAVFFLDILHLELGWMDVHLLNKVSHWKSLRKWDGRSWEGPVV
jgi:hypothetical protein